MKIAVVTPKNIRCEVGGAENFFDGLVTALNRAGHRTTQIDVIIDDSTFEGILEAYCRCFYLDLDEYDLIISTKAPTYMVRHKNHISYLLHTMRVFYDMFEREYGPNNRGKQKERTIIHALDKYGLDPVRIRAHFVNGNPVYQRMTEADPFWNDVSFKVLHHPSNLKSFLEPGQGEFVFFPSRLHRWKRPDLLIKAMEYVTTDVPLLISGQGEDEEFYRHLAHGHPNIRFLGQVDEATLIELYSRSIVVPFVPINEDYGLITIEAFMSKKPVITCTDSGEPVHIVEDGVSGFVVEPDPQKIAEKIDYCVNNPDVAALMGEKGFQSIQDITWDNVIQRLLGSFDWSPGIGVSSPITVLITDMQPIEPAIGGGRLRLKGLYSHLGDWINPLYIGTYDWKGEKEREVLISTSLRELDIPLSTDHFKLNEYLNALLPGKTVIDTVFPLIGEASPDFINTVREHAKKAEVIVFSHPWLYPLVKTAVNLTPKIVIYDSHNCEGYLREHLLGNSPFAQCMVNFVKFVEKELCEDSDLILVCSENDKTEFARLYGVNPEKLEVYPNGVDVKEILPGKPGDKKMIKDSLALPERVAVFIGSEYPPNVEGGRFIIDILADECPDVTFIIIGGVGNHLKDLGKKNIRILGKVSDDEKRTLLQAADIAINPMFHGSGTNIKMFDFLAAGLPTISSPVGARGIINNGAFIEADPFRFSEEIHTILSDSILRERLAARARALVEHHYDWNTISKNLGRRILTLHQAKAPFFSVVVPTLRKDLNSLIACLNRQKYKNFEVILVGPDENQENHFQTACTFPVLYLKDTPAGAARARNIGISRAKGQIIAFTDDDCQPDADWLENAKHLFDTENIIGIEGSVYSDDDKSNDPRYRIVTNKGFHGLGFMTANLLLRRDIIEKIGGFDERFDKPHFREDTDLAWRAQEHGEILFSEKVRVYHPAHFRKRKGESKGERDSFFINDPLLFKKHPNKYIQLMKAEGHYKYSRVFWKFFLDGCERFGEPVPVQILTRDPEICKHIPKEIIGKFINMEHQSC